MIRRALALACLLALWPATSSAAEVPARLRHVVAVWQTSPVFVDPLDTDELSPADASTLAQGLAHSDPPLYVAVMPADVNDDSDGSSETLLYDLYQANGRQGIYVLVNASGSIDYQSYGYLPGDSGDVDTAGDTPVSTRLTQLTHSLLAGAERDREPVRPPYRYGNGSPTGTVIGTALGGIALGIAGYWLVVLVVGLLRLALRLPFRWSRAATIAPPQSRRTARRHG